MSGPANSRVSEQHSEQLINFIVGEEEFAIDLDRVREVIACPEITRLPRTPSFVRGVIDLRGDIIPVIDMCEKLGLAKTGFTPHTAVIIVEIEGKHIGAIVDKICQVIRLDEDQITPPVRMVGGLSEEYVRGMGRLDDRLIVILETDRIFSPQEVRDLSKLGESRLHSPS